MRKKRLLIFDEDAYYAGIFAQRFETSGWSVVCAQTLGEAKIKCEKNVPDVLIADLHPMEEVLVFLQELRKNEKTQGILQIVLTELGNRQTMLQALDAGVDQYLLKGHFVPSEAVKKVNRLLEEKKSV